MKYFIALALLACASEQFIITFNFLAIKGVKDGYKFDYHPQHKLLLARNNVACYLMSARDELENAIRGEYDSDRIRTEVVNQIHNNTGIKQVTSDDIKWDFHDYLASQECSTKHVYEVDYKYAPLPSTAMPKTTPAANVMTPPVTSR